MQVLEIIQWSLGLIFFVIWGYLMAMKFAQAHTLYVTILTGGSRLMGFIGYVSH